ncbi:MULTISPECIES: nicotinate-nucleotide adenylyltransferase [Oceanimonas]|uniref:Probable nicotinate-nucleotide adenylyltransferase n=1 Tax=Oceanimonas doudoroffii TaxID=84158 RepID=A0A233RBJ0_9GAMM|nr:MULTISPECIES: nicotinate-nucleotide adenylyltransferase [Oceanimonas]NHI02164.1 putative nicotinate-nucleotide adenylyltransferase [Oceanimonas sp. MB9]OXY80762.1 nicotinic acid mononucleotide adenylyltransferase [Oceanimonas doudoroffii]
MTVPIGLLGGTFDPIHVGHLRTAIQAQEQLGLAEVRLLPNHIPPHRATPDSAPRHRLAMTRLAAAATPGLTVDERELRRTTPSYTVETLIELRRELGSRPLCFIMGMDSLCNLDKWHRWPELLDHAHLVVSHRPGWTPSLNDTLEQLYRRHGTRDRERLHRVPAGHIFLLDNPELEVSSTQIRDGIRAGNNPQYLLPEAVANYIRQQGLYTGSVV